MNKLLDDKKLHESMRFVADDPAKEIELIGEWSKQLPYFGWFWREFDWNRVPLGLQQDENVTLVGIMAKNKWYYREYYCTPDESSVIRSWCEDIAYKYTEEKIRCLTLYLQTLAGNKGWMDCDEEAIDERTRQDFANGKYSFISLEDFLKARYNPDNKN